MPGGKKREKRKKRKKGVSRSAARLCNVSVDAWGGEGKKGKKKKKWRFREKMAFAFLPNWEGKKWRFKEHC